ncbi:hypothetical protein FB451DRAFT_1492071 [Mycena latifolia]|nr:hypothetical protein FB451DRAFT_1492071 [Mycena latifolia]
MIGENAWPTEGLGHNFWVAHTDIQTSSTRSGKGRTPILTVCPAPTPAIPAAPPRLPSCPRAHRRRSRPSRPTFPSRPRAHRRPAATAPSTRRVCLHACGAAFSLANATSHNDHDLNTTSPDLHAVPALLPATPSCAPPATQMSSAPFYSRFSSLSLVLSNPSSLSLLGLVYLSCIYKHSVWSFYLLGTYSIVSAAPSASCCMPTMVWIAATSHRFSHRPLPAPSTPPSNLVHDVSHDHRHPSPSERSYSLITPPAQRCAITAASPDAVPHTLATTKPKAMHCLTVASPRSLRPSDTSLSTNTMVVRSTPRLHAHKTPRISHIALHVDDTTKVGYQLLDKKEVDRKPLVSINFGKISGWISYAVERIWITVFIRVISMSSRASKKMERVARRVDKEAITSVCDVNNLTCYLRHFKVIQDDSLQAMAQARNPGLACSWLGLWPEIAEPEPEFLGQAKREQH